MYKIITKPLNIIMITTRPLLPNNDGYTLRIYELLLGLKEFGHNITLISFCTKKQQKNITNEIYNICNKFIPINYNKNISYFRTLRALYRFTPFKAEYFNTYNAKNIIKHEVLTGDYDLVCGYHYLTSQFLDMFPKHKRWIELCDSISMLHERNKKNSTNILEKIFLSSEKNRVLKIEKECIRKYDLLTLISDIDKSYLSNYFNADKIKIIKNGTKVTNTISKDYNRNEICFLGSMSYFQNHKAVMWFIKEILPELIKTNPKIILKIIGKEPKSELLKIARNNKNIIVTGRVENVVSELITANFMICPINISAGIQNKILESMAIGVPVIATETLIKPITKDDNIIISANTKNEWIEEITKLMANKEKRDELSVKSKEFIKKNYSWGTIVKQLEECIENELYN